MKLTSKATISAAVLAASIAGGAIGATLIGGVANAQTATDDPAVTAPAAPDAAAPDAVAPDGVAPDARPPMGAAPAGPHEANGITEVPLSGDELAQVTAGVEATEPGATIDRAETDADGAAFEAHITRADGSRATITFDESFAVVEVIDGMP